MTAEIPNYSTSHCPMFWASMTPQQEAIDRYTGELEQQSEKLARLMMKWAETRDETLLETFAEAAPSFVEKSLAALGMTWPEVQFQLKIWANMQRVGDTPEKEAELLQLSEQDAEPVFQATTLITQIWPSIRRTLKGWNKAADATGISRADFGKLTIYKRERALYNIGWHPVKGFPAASANTENE